MNWIEAEGILLEDPPCELASQLETRRKCEQRRLEESLASGGGGGRLSRPPASPPLGNALPEGGINLKGSCCLRGGLAGKSPRGEADGPPVIPGAELPQPESGVARPVPDGGGGGGDGNSSQDGGEAADPDGQREAQQKHHAARQRGQDLEKRPRGESIGGTVAVGVVHLRGLRFGDLPDYSEYQDGHVKELVFKQDIFSCEL